MVTVIAIVARLSQTKAAGAFLRPPLFLFFYEFQNFFKEFFSVRNFIETDGHIP